jgi:competence protein ComEA
MLPVKTRIATLFFIFSICCIGLETGLCADQVDLNTATQEQLQTLPGIGPAIAQRIIAYRTEHPFQNVEEVQQVKGVGPKIYEQIKPLIKV